MNDGGVSPMTHPAEQQDTQLTGALLCEVARQTKELRREVQLRAVALLSDLL